MFAPSSARRIFFKRALLTTLFGRSLVKVQSFVCFVFTGYCILLCLKSLYMLCIHLMDILIGNKEKVENTKVVIRIRKSKKNRQHNGQNKKNNLSKETVEHYFLHCDRYEKAREKLIPDMSLLSRSIRLSLRVLLTVGEDNRLTETERLRQLTIHRKHRTI